MLYLFIFRFIASLKLSTSSLQLKEFENGISESGGNSDAIIQKVLGFSKLSVKFVSQSQPNQLRFGFLEKEI